MYKESEVNNFLKKNNNLIKKGSCYKTFNSDLTTQVALNNPTTTRYNQKTNLKVMGI